MESRPQLPAGRMLWVLVDAIHFRLGAVMNEFPANHFDISIQRLVSAKGIGRRVHADKGLARFDPIQEGLLVGQRQIAGGVGEDDPIVVLEAGSGHLLRHLLVCAHIIYREDAALLAELSQDFLSGGDGAVTKAFGDRDDQKFLWRGLCQARKAKHAAGQNCQAEHTTYRGTGYRFHRVNKTMKQWFANRETRSPAIKFIFWPEVKGFCYLCYLLSCCALFLQSFYEFLTTSN